MRQEEEGDAYEPFGSPFDQLDALFIKLPADLTSQAPYEDRAGRTFHPTIDPEGHKSRILR